MSIAHTNPVLGTFYFSSDPAVCRLHGYTVRVDKANPRDPDTGFERVEMEISFSAGMPRVLDAVRKARLNGNYAPVHVHGVYGRSDFGATGTIASFKDGGDGFDCVSTLIIHTQLHAFHGPVASDVPAFEALPPAPAPMPVVLPQGWLRTELYMQGQAGVADFDAKRDAVTGEVLVTMTLTRSRTAIGSIRNAVLMNPKFRARFDGGWRGTGFTLLKATVLECGEEGRLVLSCAADDYTGPG